MNGGEISNEREPENVAHKTLRLDVLVPTYNRADMIGRTLASLANAEIPQGLEVRVTVVDNNSKDGTRAAVEEWMPRFDGRLAYLFEARQGKSQALNTGINSTGGDLVGIIDDDEEVDAGWYACVRRAFEGGGVDFIGGPYMPRWGAEPPAWLPKDYLGVIGWVDGGDRIARYDDNFPGMLMGGNAVLTREVLEGVGPYTTELGAQTKCEDEEMYRRLRAAGARGFYRPDLIIYHYIPPERLTKRYFRRWCFRRGASLGLIDREHPGPVTYLAGVPRFLYGRAARATMRKARALIRQGDPAQNFSDELAVWDLAGFFYGKHFYKPS